MLFSKAYLINLAARTDRLAAVTTRLAAVGITAERFEAIKGPTSKGCFRSHLAVARKAKADAVSGNILILEDDVCFHKDFAASLAAIETQLTDLPWEALFLGRFNQLGEGLDERPNLIRISNGSGAQAYIIKADKLDEWIALLIVSGSVEIATRDLMQNWTTLSTVPPLTSQLPGLSDNFGCYVDYAMASQFSPVDYVL